MAIKIGIAPDSWGVWFPASDPNNAKQPQWWRCLDEMKVAGYEGCEIGPWGYMPNDDPKVLKNMKILEVHALFDAITNGADYVTDFEFGYKIDRTVAAVIESSKTHEWVDVK